MDCFSFWFQSFLPVTKHKSWTPENKVDLRNPEKTQKLTFFLRREGWGVCSPLWNPKRKTWVACHGKETRPNLNHWSCPRQHPHKSTMRNSAGSFVPCMPSITSSRTAMRSLGKRCKRFSRGRGLLLGFLILFAIYEFLWVGQCLSSILLQTKTYYQLVAISTYKGHRIGKIITTFYWTLIMGLAQC